MFFFKSPTTVLLCKPQVQICLTHHTTRHLEGCTPQGTSKDTQRQHLEGCTPQGTSKDAQKQHLEGYETQGTSKDAPKQHLEGCKSQSTSKNAHIKETRRIRNKSHYKGNRESHIQTKGAKHVTMNFYQTRLNIPQRCIQDEQG